MIEALDRETKGRASPTDIGGNGQDADREMYVLASDRAGPNAGKVFKIVDGSVGGGGHER